MRLQSCILQVPIKQEGTVGSRAPSVVPSPALVDTKPVQPIQHTPVSSFSAAPGSNSVSRLSEDSEDSSPGLGKPTLAGESHKRCMLGIFTKCNNKISNFGFHPNRKITIFKCFNEIHCYFFLA